MTNVDKTIDARDEGYKPVSDTDKQIQNDCEQPNLTAIYNTDISVDDPEIYDGAHVSLQIVGKRLQEEKMLAIAAHVEKLLAHGQ